MQIASGLHRVGCEIVNSYLIVDQNGVTIIEPGCQDTGSRSTPNWPHSAKAWTMCGRSSSPTETPTTSGSPPGCTGRQASPPTFTRRTSTAPDHPYPGHTPGSIAVHVSALDALFLGHTMTTRNVLTGVTGPEPAPFTLEPEQAVASLNRIKHIEATWLLPGHGPAWDGGVPEAVRLIRAAAADSHP